MYFQPRSASNAGSKGAFPPPPTPKSRVSKLTKSRRFVLPSLLVYTFTVLVLGVIYAYCVTKPTSDLAPEKYTGNSTASDATSYDTSIFGKRSTIGGGNTPEEVASYLSQSDGTGSNGTRAIMTANNRTDKADNQTAIFWYTATVPTLGLIHLTSELVLHLRNPDMLTSRTAHHVLLTVTLLLAAGWTITTTFWLHCELPGRGNAGVCPPQVRGHFMYGIHELSIAKEVLAFVIILLYLIHAGIITGSIKSYRRIWKMGARWDAEARDIELSVEQGKQAGRKDRRVTFSVQGIGH